MRFCYLSVFSQILRFGSWFRNLFDREFNHHIRHLADISDMTKFRKTPPRQYAQSLNRPWQLLMCLGGYAVVAMLVANESSSDIQTVRDARTTYKLVMSKNDKVCSVMEGVFNDPLGGRRLTGYAHAIPFAGIPWRSMVIQESDGGPQIKRDVAQIDLNNDGSDEAVMRFRTNYRGDYYNAWLNIYSADIGGIQQPTTMREIRPKQTATIRQGYVLLKETLSAPAGTYGPKEYDVPERTTEGHERIFINDLEPFIVDGRYYLAMRSYAVDQDTGRELTNTRQWRIVASLRRFDSSLKSPLSGKLEHVCYFVLSEH